MFWWNEQQEPNIFIDESDLSEKAFRFTPPDEDISDEHPLRKRQDRLESPKQYALQKTDANLKPKITEKNVPFIKREVIITPEKPSKLSELVKTKPNNKSIKATLFVPVTSGYQRVKLDVDLSITGFELLQRTLEECRELIGKYEYLDMDANAYILREATNKGEQVVTTARPYDLWKSIREYSCFIFILLPNEDYKKSLEGSAWQNLKSSRLTVNGTQLDDARLKVYLPNSTVPKVVCVSPDIYIKDLHKVLCSKLDFELEKSYIHIEEHGEKKPIPKRLYEKTLCNYEISKVYLLKTVQEEMTAPNDNKESPRIIIDDLLTSPLEESVVEYIVTKTNMFGVKRERILTINANSIFTKPVNESKSAFDFWIQEKHPIRYIKDLSNIKENIEKRTIELTFVDENGSQSVLYYEAKTKIEAAEICAKLREKVKVIKSRGSLRELKNTMSSEKLKTVDEFDKRKSVALNYKK